MTERFRAVRRSPLTEQVVDQITERILSGRLPPGAPLRQAHLAEELSVSRTPLREALHILQADGLVSQRTNGTFRVISPTLDDARDVYEMREAIDAFAARLAAIRATPAQIANLHRLVGEIEAATDPYDGPRYLAAITEYHILLLQASGNKAILGLENTLRMSTRVLFQYLENNRERLGSAIEEHRRLTQAIRDRDPMRAETLAREHVIAVVKFWIDGAERPAVEARSPQFEQRIGPTLSA